MDLTAVIASVVGAVALVMIVGPLAYLRFFRSIKLII